MRPHDSLGRAVAWYWLVDVEVIPFGIGHRDSVMIRTLRDDRGQPRSTERNESRRLSLDPLAPGVERQTATTARVTSMWMRFLIDFFSGTIWNQMRGPSPFGFSMMSEPPPSSSSGTQIDLKKSSHESKPDGAGAIT